ncbi:hypothetical protein E4T56_gene9729 [Termitomyces sp. T112]|nr:hypothetical protein E4T56_gene9729 [Termitomyces sp. T112]
MQVSKYLSIQCPREGREAALIFLGGLVGASGLLLRRGVRDAHHGRSSALMYALRILMGSLKEVGRDGKTGEPFYTSERPNHGPHRQLLYEGEAAT